jgi:hypothetical protein
MAAALGMSVETRVPTRPSVARSGEFAAEFTTARPPASAPPPDPSPARTPRVASSSERERGPVARRESDDRAVATDTSAALALAGLYPSVPPRADAPAPSAATPSATSASAPAALGAVATPVPSAGLSALPETPMRWAAAGLAPGFAAGVAPPAPAGFVGSASGSSTATSALGAAAGSADPTRWLLTGLLPGIGAPPMRGDAPAAAGPRVDAPAVHFARAAPPLRAAPGGSAALPNVDGGTTSPAALAADVPRDHEAVDGARGPAHEAAPPHEVGTAADVARAADAVPTDTVPTDTARAEAAREGNPERDPSRERDTASDTAGSEVTAALVPPVTAPPAPPPPVATAPPLADGLVDAGAAEAPESPAPLPDHLDVSVRDALGDWSVEVRRHEHSLDLLFRGDAGLAPAVRSAEADIRSALTAGGTTLGLLEFAGGGHASSDPRGDRNGDRSGRDGSARSRADAPTIRSSSASPVVGRRGERIDRVA